MFRAMLIAALLSCLPLSAQAAEKMHGLSMYGDLKYAADFTHLDYVNPNAPRGGTIRFAGQGTFDSLHPHIIKGVAAPGLSLTVQTLLSGTDDEPFSEYGQLAESVEMPEDRSFVIFNLNPAARFHDGKPVLASDVVWTFNTLIEKGHPFYRAYYADVVEVKAEDKHRVKFTFKAAGNRELPLIMGQLPVLAEHDWKNRDFAATQQEPILGSGPYKVAKVDAGRRIEYTRVKDWWAADLPINKGRYNFDTITYDLFRDQAVLLQALFAGEYDVREENIAKAWTGEYTHPAVTSGKIKKEEIAHNIPTGMQAFIFNIRRPFFSDVAVREALQYAFDYEWSNKQFASGAYKRTASYFENSELAARGLPEGRVLEILQELAKKYPEAVPARALTEAYQNPVTDGSGRGIRANLGKAKKILEDAGWKLGDDGVLAKNGQALKFEILSNSEAFERWVQPMIGNLKKLGIVATLRVVDTAQYQNRMDSFDFDVTVSTFGQSLSPGNEQRDFWHSEKADVAGSRNLIGIKNPAIDAVIDMIINAPDRAELVARAQALDRLLLWDFYVIPQWHIGAHRVAYWDKFGRPSTPAKYGLGIADTWWFDSEKVARLSAGAAQGAGN